MSNLLSGEELVQVHSKTQYELPSAGIKAFEPTNSWLESKQIQSALDERKTLLQEERVEKWSSLLGAEWVPERGKARVLRLNRHWEVFGHHSDDTDWLFPEEALYLLEMNCLECLFNDVPLSVEKGYSVLLGGKGGCSLNEYRVFAHLCRAGYRLVRHLPELTVTAYERQIRLDQHVADRKTYIDEPPRPDLPPKTILQLSEDTEVTIKSPQVSEEKENNVIKEASDKLFQISNEGSGEKEVVQASSDKISEISLKLNSDQSTGCSSDKEQCSSENKTCTNSGQSLIQIQDEGNMRDPSLQTTNVEKCLMETFCKEIGGKELPVVPMESSDEKDMLDTSTIIDKQKQQTETTFEVIDLLDSDEQSSSEEEDSSDSDIEIVHESAPKISHQKKYEKEDIENENEEEEDDDDDTDDEIEIIEVPKKNIVVATILSSDTDDQDGDSDGSGKSYDGNWKRSKTKRKRFVRPANLNKFNYLAIGEFCLEKPQNSENPLKQTLVNGSVCVNKTNVDSENSNSIEFISLNKPSSTRESPQFPVHKTRNEILDLMPTMGGNRSKLITLESADMRLIPSSIIPKQQSYTYNTSTLRARIFSTFNGYRGRRNFRGQMFNNFTPYYNPQRNVQATLQPIAQMFGNDIHAMARGMMQYASALLMNSPQNQQLSLMPFNSQPSPDFIPQTRSTPQRLRNLFDYTGQSRCPDPPFTSQEESQNWYLQNQGFGSEPSFNTNVGNDSSDRRFSPVIGRGFPRGRARIRGNNFNRRGSFRENSQVDPAYVKPDVPLDQHIDIERGDFIPLGSSNKSTVEVIEIKDDEILPKRGISNKFQKRKQNKKLKLELAKKRRMSDQNLRNKTSEIIFLDENGLESDISVDSSSVKQEVSESVSNIKTEPSDKNCEVKQEVPEEAVVKEEIVEGNQVKIERNETLNQELSVKNEVDSEVRVKVEQDVVGENVHVEIKIENSSDSCSVSSLPYTLNTQVKTEPIVKAEPQISSDEVSSTCVKMELELNTNIKDEPQGKEIEIRDATQNESVMLNSQYPENQMEESYSEIETSQTTISNESQINVAEPLMQGDNCQIAKSVVPVQKEVCKDILNSNSVQPEMEDEFPTSTCEINHSNKLNEKIQNDKNDSDYSKMDVDIPPSEKSNIGSDFTENIEQNIIDSSKISSWAQVKQHNVSLHSLKESEEKKRDNPMEEESDEEDFVGDIQPLLKPKHCKTVGSVLSAIQIFSPFSPKVPKDLPKLKISFDMYLSADFKKSQRGLPHFRIVVISGEEPVPSPAQLFEVQDRFEDKVPLLQAVVMAGSVVCYTSNNISLPVDEQCYKP